MTLQQIEDALTVPLADIASHWDAMLSPRGTGSIARGPSPSITMADDHADTEQDIPRVERLLSLRREVTECLNGWSRVVMEDRPVMVALPHGTDVKGMCEFLARHAQWFAGHEAAEVAAEELRLWAHKVRTATAPARKDWISVGECPVTIGVDGESVVCATTVRVYPHSQGDIRCRGCGTSDTIDGWVLRIVGQQPMVTAEQLITILHKRLGMVVTTKAVRQWVSRGMIRPEGTDEQGRNLYDRNHVLHALKRREEKRLAGTRQA